MPTRTLSACPPARCVHLLLIFLLLSPLALVQPRIGIAAEQHQVTLIARGETTNESLGTALASSGDTLVAGAPAGTGTTFLSGLARVFVRDSSGWNQQMLLMAPDGRYNDMFGAAVAIDGDTIAIGAPNHAGSAGESMAGAVYVFTRSSGLWSLQATLRTNNYTERFGNTLALAGDTLFVGAYGTVYVFTRTATSWSQQSTLRASDGQPGNNFGASIALSQGWAVIGAPNARAAYAFENDGTGWVERQKLVSGVVEDDSILVFGNAVAIDGTTLVIGAPRMSITGTTLPCAYVFTRSDGLWTRQARLVASTNPRDYSFGSALSLQGTTLVVGAPDQQLDPDAPTWLGGSGAAHVFQGSAAVWNYTALLSGDQLLSIWSFGKAVLVDGDTLLVGAPRSGEPIGGSVGSIYTAALSTLTQAIPDHVSLAEDSSMTITPLDNDIAGPAGSLSPAYTDLALLQRPRHGMATVDRLNGTIVYTPTANFNGEEVFSYVAGWGLPAEISVSVLPVPDAPIFTSRPPVTAVENVPYTYSITTADLDPNDTAHFSSANLPGWLALYNNSDGTAVLSGTATLADVGLHPITLIVTDQDGLTATQAFTVNVTPYLPSPPTNLMAQVLSRALIRLTWSDTSTDEQGFLIERRTNGDVWMPIKSLGPNITIFDDAGRTCNTRYDYRVASLNATGRSYSNEQSVTITDCMLDPPWGLMATTITTHSLALGWNDSNANGTGFIIERSLDGVVWQTLSQTPATMSWYTDDQLICGPGFFYRVRAFNLGGISDATPMLRASVCAPTAPNNLNVLSTTQNTIRLSWADTSDNESWFMLVASRDGGRQWFTATSTSRNISNATISGLSCGTAYMLRVQAYNGSGTTESSSISATTMPCTIIYVRAQAAAGGDGSSWATAYPDLQPALADAAGRSAPGNVQIWVAAGTYKPSASADRNASFRLINNTALYGGFAGNEIALEERNWRSHPSILSGDIGVSGNNGDNSYHVVTSFQATPATILDGFTITAGNANGNWVNQESMGGGMLNDQGSPSIRNAIFTENSGKQGGAMANVGGNLSYTVASTPSIENVLFVKNTATKGGAMANAYGGNPSIRNTVFNGNYAETGGAMHNYWGSSPTLTNVTFSNNAASFTGGAITNSANARPIIRNTIFFRNGALFAGPETQISNESSNAYAIVSDSLLQVNIEVGGTRNRIADPHFVDINGADTIAGTLDDDLRLQSDSPAIDAGNNTSMPVTIIHDLAGNPRFVDHRNIPDTGIGTAPIIDIGAYEYQPPPAVQSAPADLRAVATSRVSILLTWRDMSDDEEGFKIERQAGMGEWTELIRVPAGTTTYTDIPLSCGSSYTYRVRAFNPGGDSVPSELAQVVTEACQAHIIYVDQRAQGLNDGSSWANAYVDLQSALTIRAIRGDQIWVATGTYRPSAQGDRTASFHLIPGVALYGGFDGESSPELRDPSAHPTIISGDLQGNDLVEAPSYASVTTLMNDNSTHVVMSDGADAATILDGVTITGGNAYQDGGTLTGGGMLNQHGNPTIRRVIFRNNAGSHGAAVANLYGAPHFQDVVFTKNWAANGGGMYNQHANPQLEHVSFLENSTYAGRGAGMYNQDSNPILQDVTFTMNQAYWGAGGMDNTNSNPIMQDVTFERNTGEVGGMSNRSSNPTLRRVVFQQNQAQYTLGGGGMYNAQSAPTLIDTLFVENSSNPGGGGMANVFSNPTLINVRFIGNRVPNTANGYFFGGGGGILNVSSSPILINVSLNGNRAGGLTLPYGGALANYQQSRPILHNVTLTNNGAAIGGAIYNAADSTAIIRNSILWGNSAPQGAEVFDAGAIGTDIQFSIIVGGHSGVGNQDSDPHFVDARGTDMIPGTLDDDLRLRVHSSAIDAGNNADVPDDSADLDGDMNTSEPLPRDLSNHPRFIDASIPDIGAGSPPIIDIGAYEYQYPSQLTINHPSGQPGSAFVITGEGWEPALALRISIAGMELGTFTSNAKGSFSVMIQTLSEAKEGSYVISVTPVDTPPSERTSMLHYMLEQGAPLHAKQASDYELVVPLQVPPAMNYTVFLPLID